MDRPQLVRHVRIALAEVLNREIPELSEDSRLFEDLALDSTSIIELLMGIEDTVDIQIEPDELTPEAFATVGSLVDYLESGMRKATV
jgi:acyl carrier protein